MKSETQIWIEDAIKGGWKIDGKMGEYLLEEDGSFHFDIQKDEDGEPNGYTTHLGLILLDPLAWQAVGKTRGWDKYKTVSFEEKVRSEMHLFIDLLADGQTIEQALLAIK